jgi:MFS family permease
MLYAFLFIYASSSLKLSTNLVSNLIIFQTAGIVVGGLVTGQISARFGVKRMLLLTEVTGLLIPILALLCLVSSNPYIPISFAIFLSGFNRSGTLGYTNYMIEVIDKEKVIYHVAATQLVLLPISFLSTIAGVYIQSHSMEPIFTFQIFVSVLAVLMCIRLRLVKREDTI